VSFTARCMPVDGWRLRLACAALGLAISSCGDPQVRAEVQGEPSARLVSVAPIERGPVRRTIHATGTLQPKHQYKLSFKVGGVVEQVTVEEGSRVRRGQVLARLDPTEISGGESQAREALAKAERDAARARNLSEQKGIARTTVDDAETALALARANAETASFNLRHAALVAPASGVIDSRMVEPGQIVGPGAPLLSMSSSGSKVVRVNLVDRDVLDVHLGDEARVSLDARPQQTLRAHVSRIANMAATGTGTYEVELALADDESRSLPADLTVKVALDRIEHPVASVPLTALVEGEGERAAVYVLEGERVRRAPVRIAFFSGDRAALAEGLDGSNAVVSAGVADLNDGARVRVAR
jgi:RND family efflux transporter MFP subunit